jgi:hypothetical protein
MNTAFIRQITQRAAALSLSAMLTLTILVSINRLALAPAPERLLAASDQAAPAVVSVAQRSAHS